MPCNFVTVNPSDIKQIWDSKTANMFHQHILDNPDVVQYDVEISGFDMLWRIWFRRFDQMRATTYLQDWINEHVRTRNL